MKKIIVVSLILGASLGLSACGVQKEVVQNAPPVVEQNSSVTVEADTGVVDNGSVNTKTSTGSDNKNEMNFSDSQIQDILAKIEENTKKQQEKDKNVTSTWILIDGNYKAEYIPSKNNADDKIHVTVNGLEKVVNLEEINNYNRRIQKLYDSKECTSNDYDNPKCSKSHFAWLYGLYSKWEYISYMGSLYEWYFLKILQVATWKEIAHISLPGGCENNENLVVCKWNWDGWLAVVNLQTATKYNIWIWNLEWDEFSVMWFTIDNKYIYSKFDIYTKNPELKIYDLTTLKEVFSKEITK